MMTVDFAHFQRVFTDLGAKVPPEGYGVDPKPVIADESVPEGEVWFEEYPDSYFRRLA